MSTPTDSSRDELRALRERAYGRDADIHDDPAALARLTELEELAAAHGAADVAEAPGDASAPAGPDADPDPAADPPANTHDDPAHSHDPDARDDPDADAALHLPAPRPWWRRTAVLWTASVVAALFVGAGLTLAVQSLEAGKIAVLQVDPGAEWPEDFWGDRTPDSLTFESFYGLSVVSQPQLTGDGTQGPVPCVIVFSAVDEDPSYLGGSCGAGSFPAQAALVVGRQAPSALRERFPEGTALQFVLDGSQVHVYAREPGTVDETP